MCCKTVARPTFFSALLRPLVCASVLLMGCVGPGWAQGVANDGPLDKDKQERPPVIVPEKLLDEERLVGPNKQPEWTTERRFAESRVYVLPPGMIEFEQWWRGTYKKGDTRAHRFLTEVAFGLPGRWQLDLYGRFEGETGSATRYVGEQIEARYALAEWGRIPANPTFYLEFKNNQHGPNVLEGKLLLGDELRSGWHWAANLSYEEEQGGSREIERALTLGLSRTIRDSRFSIGLEAVYENVTARGSSPENAFLLGPSIQWRPTKEIHVDFAPLFGMNNDAPHSQIFIVFGYTLRPGGKGKDVNDPVSSRTR